jgi:hypothetical protein
MSEAYIDLRGDRLDYASLDAEEKALVEHLQEYAKAHPDWLSAEYRNYWQVEVAKLYEARGLTRPEIIKTAVYRIGQDIASRMHIASGLARPSDYRDEIEVLIQSRFRTRREFCQATGLSEDMLSHVLARRKHLAIDTLAEALGRIGYAIHIAPVPNVK